MIRFLDRRTALLTAAAALAAHSGRPAQASDEPQPDPSKRLVVTFCETAFNRKDFEAAKAYLGLEFIDHDPAAPADGIEGMKRFIGFQRSNFPLPISRSSAYLPTATMWSSMRMG